MKFLGKYKWIVRVGIGFSLLYIFLFILYDINYEFALYFLLFTVIEFLLMVFLLYREFKRAERSDKKEIKAYEPEHDERWLEMKEKEDFFALWAHQIKTPIAALRLLFQSNEVDVNQCKLETFKIENYVELALNYLRFDALSSDLSFEDCKLESMVKAVVKKHSVIFINKHLSVKLENLDYSVLTDEKWFSFCFEQVLSNALKYTSEGGVTISAKEEAGEVVVCVKDTGIGIRSEDIPRLFEKGFTGFNGRMDKKASGLGLYLCKGVCDKLGHDLWIESEEGMGTSVYIKIGAEKVDRSSLNKD